MRRFLILSAPLLVAASVALPQASRLPTTVPRYSRLQELPLSAFKPEGWLRQFLVNQRNGLTGHLEAAHHPFDKSFWFGEDYLSTDTDHSWVPYEQTAYWVDGMVRCGGFLGDSFLTSMARKRLEYVLSHPDADGYLGPKFLKGPGQMPNRWPHVVFFRALIAEHSFTGDARIPQAIARHYLSNTDPHNQSRNVCNVEIMLWAYGQTGDRRLLDMAVKAYSEFQQRDEGDDTTLANMASDRVMTSHGVSFNEQAKQAAILYIHTGDRKYLDPVVNAYRKVVRDQMLVDGIHSCTEGLRGKDPLDSHETCDIADFIWSVGYLLMATGKADYGDKLERAAFNAAPGAVKPDFKALQYFSCSNQVVCDRHSNHNEFFRGSAWMSYRPNPGTQCCAGDVNRMMPNYVSRMWMNDGRGGLVAALYGPSRVKVQVGPSRTLVSIQEETDYPFRDTISFRIGCAKPTRFPFTLRIPGWTRNARISLNGRLLRIRAKPGTFSTVDRTFRNGDRLTLVLPMHFKLTEWPKGGVALERGPLAYSLRIEEDWRRDKDDRRSTSDFPAWNLYPASDWNYALALSASDLDSRIKIIQRPMTANPWSIKTAPVELRVPARKLNGWAVEDHTRIDPDAPPGTVPEPVLFTPQLPDPMLLRDMFSERTETVTLVPYGCAKLRVTVFPKGR